MKAIAHSGIAAAFAALLLAPGPILAQAQCPEGKTATGECVNPGLAQALRQSAIIFAQPNISQTHYPVLPNDDFKFRYPNELNPNQLKPGTVGTPVPPPSP